VNVSSIVVAPLGIIVVYLLSNVVCVVDVLVLTVNALNPGTDDFKNNF
jgi:hypothetical protein